MSKTEHLCTSESLDSMIDWSIQECVHTMPKRKDIRTDLDLREETVAAHQPRYVVRLFPNK